MKFDVKNRFTGNVQFTADIDCDENASSSAKLGLAVRWGRTNDADLRGAYLGGADLRGAILDKENDIRIDGDNPILMLSPIGSTGGTLIAYKTNKGIYLRRGCFFDTIKKFKIAVKATHGDNQHAILYRAACELIEQWAINYEDIE